MKISWINELGLEEMAQVYENQICWLHSRKQVLKKWLLCMWLHQLNKFMWFWDKRSKCTRKGRCNNLWKKSLKVTHSLYYWPLPLQVTLPQGPLRETLDFLVLSRNHSSPSSNTKNQQALFNFLTNEINKRF